MIWWDHGIARLCDREALRVAPFGAKVRVSEMGHRRVTFESAELTDGEFNTP